MNHLITFIIASLLLNLTPGPDMMYVIARSIGQGRRAGFVSALGIGAGCVVHILAAALGLAALLRSWPVAFDIVRYAGAAYLLYLGLRLIVKKQHRASNEALPFADSWVIFRQGVITNVLNPKVALFFLAFLPQFVSPLRGAVGWQIAALGFYFDIQGTIVNLLVAALAGVAGTFLRRGSTRSITERASGAVFIALGLRVGLARG